jgi:hypothetical protein
MCFTVNCFLGSIQILSHNSEDDTQVARLLWSYGLPGEVPGLLGEDVATLKDGKIKTMYTFIDDIEKDLAQE